MAANAMIRVRTGVGGEFTSREDLLVGFDQIIFVLILVHMVTVQCVLSLRMVL